ncbi:MAG: hypothetical protein AB2A00_21275 [Myxococcota bacterium]
MAKKQKTLEERLMGAAVLKATFENKREGDSPGFQLLYQGVLEDLELTEAAVDEFLATHRDEVEAKIRKPQ